ncbi:MAG: ATP-binding protein [Bacteroidales bacterium]|jgi:hypothetical protein
MISRTIIKKIKELVKLYPVLTLTGPRQSGKTTLLKKMFPEYAYYSLEDPDTRMYAATDPRKFLSSGKKGMIIDEAQQMPELFSYIQGIVDDKGKEGMFILSGSHNFLLLEKITQSLAGRVAVLKLMPFSLRELAFKKYPMQDYETYLFKGFYPRMYDKKISPADFYPYYLQTYIERDVRLIRNITDQSAFIRFIKLLAGRAGQLLNITSLSNDCGISQITCKEWLSILEASYIIYLLMPHHKNYNKRLVKMPKIYFHDTGLLCYLLGIKSTNQLSTHYAIGSLFENFIMNEFMKYSYHHGAEPAYYFWRDKMQKEIDLLIENGHVLIPVEIKSGKTFNYEYFKQVNYWNKLSGNNSENSYMVYGGNKNLSTSSGHVISWKNMEQLMKYAFNKKQ